jgi:seryl-tRNA(Sec) selenium transferase
VRLVKLTGMPHPDYGNESRPLYIDAEHVLYVERSFSGWMKEDIQEQWRQSLQQLFEEVERVGEDLKRMRSFEGEDQVNKTMDLRDAIGSLSSAANLCARFASNPAFHKRVEVTTIGLAYEGSGNTLARVHVMESPDQVAQLIYPDDPRTTS